MATTKEVIIPDIGGADDIDVIEILVSPGDDINKDDSLITLEGDKATMEIPAPFAGKVIAIKLAVGDKVSEGDLILTLEVEADEPVAEITTEQAATSVVEEAAATVVEPEPASHEPQLMEVKVPDIGGAEDIDVIEVMVAAGDEVEKDDSLITLEGDKATMEIPSPYQGKIEKLQVKIGDKVSQDAVILTMLAVAPAATTTVSSVEPASATAATPAVPAAKLSAPRPVETAYIASGNVYTGPAVRRIAREFGIDLKRVKGTGRKGRILKQDVQNYVRTQLARAESGAGGSAIPAAPVVDFSKFGATETKPLNKIKRLTGTFMQRNWLNVPHVTQFEEADITEMEAFRQLHKAKAKAKGFSFTPLVFIMKAVVAALQEFPQFNSSLAPDGQSLILKKYFNLGIAADTPNGLVVPVIRDVDKKGLFALAEELATVSKKARDVGLTPAEMQGGCLTISSLGGIGGTAFTPIVNMPEVAILGVSKSAMKPVYNGKEFEPRLMLPLSLSYDHRVIDGADGARFIVYLAKVLHDYKESML